MHVDLKHDNIELSVKDTGIGIASKFTKLIFKRFQQAESHSKRSYEGSGLGLSIAEAYTKLLGGKLIVHSKENVGSTFKFTLPLNIDNFIKDTDTEINKVVEISNFQKSKVLVVEDDDTSAQYLTILLQQENFEVIHAKNGKISVEILKLDPSINLVLMDIRMPVMDGYKATKEIRKFNKTIPIIAQTAYSIDNDTAIAIEAGCTSCIAKPIKKDLLFKIIAEVLSVK